MISTRKCKTYYVRKTLYCCSRSFWIFCFSSRCSKLGPAQAFYFQKSLFLPNIPRNIIQCQWYFSIFKGRTFLVSLSWFQIYSRNVCGEEALNFVTIQSCLFNCQDAHCIQRNMSNILRYIWNICGGKPPSIRGVLIEVAIRWSPNQLTYLPSLIRLLDKYFSSKIF